MNEKKSNIFLNQSVSYINFTITLRRIEKDKTAPNSIFAKDVAVDCDAFQP